MRVLGLLCATAVAACFSPITLSAENAVQHHAAEEQSEPYHKHHDTRHGHDHFYPDRGAIVRDLPQGTIGTSYAGVSYRYHDGIWLEPRGPAYMVIAPPIGLVAPTLPLYSTIVTHGSESYLYANDTYYRPRPDLNGYEVVNDPTEEAPAAPAEALVGGQMPGAATAGPASTSNSPTVAPGVAAVIVPAASAASAAPAISGAAAPGATAAGATATGATAPPPATAAVAPGSFAPQAAAIPPPTSTSIPPAAAAGSVPVVLPAGSAGSQTQKGPKVFLYPKNGQTADQQARDRYDCYRFAVAQSGYDPMRAAGAASEQQADYERAQSACFEGRGYSNR
jgi:hypothetical protein